MTDLKTGDLVQLASDGSKMTLSNQKEGVLESIKRIIAYPATRHGVGCTGSRATNSHRLVK